MAFESIERTAEARREFTVLLVDLDGTIIDSGPGIIASLVYTLERLGHPVPDAAGLRAFIGPPIFDGFARLGLDPEQAKDALVIYRQRYRSHGMLDAPVYPGMASWLRDQAARERPMSLATSKPESVATAILEHLGLADAFTTITGASDDESRSEKSAVVAEALRRLGALGTDLSSPLMIGDRIHDVEGAAANGVPTAFVTWGYGSAEESFGAIAVADTVPELRQVTD